MPAWLKLLCAVTLLAVAGAVKASSCSPGDQKRWREEHAKLPAPKTGYPFYARAEGREGQATVSFVVEPDGIASQVSILLSSGYQDLDDAARRAVAERRYPPFICAGQVKRSSTYVHVNFTLRIKPASAPASPAKREMILFITEQLGAYQQLEAGMEKFYHGLESRLKAQAPDLEEAKYQAAIQHARQYVETRRSATAHNLQANLVSHFNARFSEDEIVALANILRKPGGKTLLRKLAAVNKDAFAVTSRWIQRTALMASQEAAGTLGVEFVELEGVAEVGR